MLEFSGPINFLGPSPKAVEAVKQNAKLIRYYPDPNPVEFKEEIAKYVGQGVEEENLLLGNGSIELIYMITEILPRGFKALIPVPSFSEYEKATLRVGGEPVFLQLPENFELETDKIKKAVTDDTKIMCICNPHSPSGTLYSKEKLLDLVKFCNKKDIIFSVDENYIEFADKSLDNTLAGMVKDYENLFVIRSVTKFYGMAGIRFGYAIAAGNLIDKLQTTRLPWSINGLACQVTMAAINDLTIHTEHKRNNRQKPRNPRQSIERNRRLTRLPIRNQLSVNKNHKLQNHIHHAQRITGSRTHPNTRLLHLHGIRRPLLPRHSPLCQRQPATCRKNKSHLNC